MTGPRPTDHTAPASRVGDRYVLRGEIGRGGMASVHRAHDVVLDREVAIKLPHAHLATDAAFLERFRREARAAAALTHPNVVAVHDWGQDDTGGAYLVLQLVEGPSLREVLRWAGRLDGPTTAAVLLPGAEGLGAAHVAGFVHRDVKPENLLLGRDGRVRVTDFGLARAAASATSTFGSGVLVGSPHYLAPEAIHGERLDPRADVYALGIVLFECLTGRPPHEGESAYATVVAHTSRPVPPPSEVVPDVDPRLDDLVLAATAIDRADRPDDAALFATELATLMPEGRRVDLARLLHAMSGSAAPRSSTGTLALPVEHLTTTVAARPRRDDLAGGVIPVGTGPMGGGPTDPPPAGAPVGEDPGPVVTDLHAPDSPDVAPDAIAPDDLDGQRDIAAGPVDDEVLEPDVPPRRRWPLVALLVVALLGAAMAGGYLLWDRVLAPVVPIPAVTGLPEAEAVEQLEASGFEAVVADDRPFDLDVPAGRVLAQDPTGQARTSTVVTLVLSAGPRQVEVPDVVGLQRGAALEAIDEAGLEAAAVAQHHPDAPAGEVTAVDPAPGTVLDEASTVELTLSLGPPPIEVPDLRGVALDDARAAVTELGLELQVTERRHDEDQPEGAVIAQSPGPGAVLFREDVVEVAVSEGPPPIEVPTVRGLQRAEAVQVLEAAGFVVDVELRGGFGAFLTPGRVFDQDPGPGAMRQRGATVTVYAYED